LVQLVLDEVLGLPLGGVVEGELLLLVAAADIHINNPMPTPALLPPATRRQLYLQLGLAPEPDAPLSED
jgi:hypothetical protein